MKEETVFFNYGSIKLEGALISAKGDSPSTCVLVCHPHPQYGGNMDNNVVVGVTSALSKRGFTTLRFNLRGVGRSGGSHGGGIEEVKDVKAAVDFLDGEDKVKTDGIFLAGYSFGSMVGLPVAVEDDRIKGWVGISPPIAMYDFSYLEKSQKPKLILHGDSDFACPTKEMESLYETLKEPKSINIIPGADHFLWGKEEVIATHILNFLSKFAG